MELSRVYLKAKFLNSQQIVDIVIIISFLYFTAQPSNILFHIFRVNIHRHILGSVLVVLSKASNFLLLLDSSKLVKLAFHNFVKMHFEKQCLVHYTLFLFGGILRSWFTPPWATMLVLPLDCSTAALPAPQNVLSIWKRVEPYGISILASVADFTIPYSPCFGLRGFLGAASEPNFPGPWSKTCCTK